MDRSAGAKLPQASTGVGPRRRRRAGRARRRRDASSSSEVWLCQAICCLGGPLRAASALPALPRICQHRGERATDGQRPSFCSRGLAPRRLPPCALRVWRQWQSLRACLEEAIWSERSLLGAAPRSVSRDGPGA